MSRRLASWIAQGMPGSIQGGVDRMARPKKDSLGGSNSRDSILDATERVMVEEGYAAVTTRKVAALSGITSAAVHYHFRTIDDLLVALYRRTTKRNLDVLTSAIASPKPLHALWEMGLDSKPTALALEFMALANHRKVIRDEISRYAEFGRGVQTGTIARLLSRRGIAAEVCPASALSLIITGIYRVLVMENGLGILAGHEEARDVMQRLIDWLEPDPAR